MKALIFALALGVALPISAFAQDAPPFLKAMESKAAMVPMTGMAGGVQSKGRIRRGNQRIDGLATGAEIPCQYCIYAHTVGPSKLGRRTSRSRRPCRLRADQKMSIELSGNQYDVAEFKKQIDAALRQHEGAVVSDGGVVYPRCLIPHSSCGCTSKQQANGGTRQ